MKLFACGLLTAWQQKLLHSGGIAQEARTSPVRSMIAVLASRSLGAAAHTYARECPPAPRGGHHASELALLARLEILV
jgi:hypothetical protein